jgi:hypothetical protein
MNTHDPSLAEMAVQATGQPVSRYCVAYLGLLERGLTINETLSFICEQCPIRQILLATPMDPPVRRHRNKLARIQKKFFPAPSRQPRPALRQFRFRTSKDV